MKTKMSDRDKAMLLLAEVEKAIASGTRHFSLRGEPLNTVRDIIGALARDGSINFKTAGTTEIKNNPYDETFKVIGGDAKNQ